MKRCFFALALMAAFFNNGFSQKFADGDEAEQHIKHSRTPMGKAVIGYNNARLDLMKKPGDDEKGSLKEALQKFVKKGSPAEAETLGLAASFLAKGTPTLAESSHDTIIKEVNLQKDGTVVVKTLESPRWLFGGTRDDYIRDRLLHTYLLEQINYVWVVVTDHYI